MFRLDPNGIWQQAAGSDTIVAGEAMWIYASSGSDFFGDLHLQAPQFGDIKFARQQDVHVLTLRNHSTTPKTVALRMLADSDPPLKYREFDVPS